MQQLTENHNNYVKVAYQLVHDYKQTIEFGNISEKLAKEHLVETGGSPEWLAWNNPTNESPDVVAADAVYSSSYITKLPPSSYLSQSQGSGGSQPLQNLLSPNNEDNSSMNHLANQPAPQATASSGVTLQTKAKKHKKKSKWHFGIRSRGSPKKIMMELYKAMKNIDLEWKPISIFHVRCRYQENGQILASWLRG